MTTPNIAVYAGDPMGPNGSPEIFAQAAQAGWTTIILGLFHIGRPSIPGQQYGDIIFGADPIIIQDGNWKLPDDSWPTAVAQLMAGGLVTQIYASFGGGGVEDFESLKAIYEQNGNSYAGTPLETNFQLFRQKLPAITGIDLDCEETYDEPSFIAFCQLVAGLGFSLTFCPYDNQPFWANALAALIESNPGAVKWWNLQCYDGGFGNDPQQWVEYVASVIPGFQGNDFILAGGWTNSGVQGVQALIAGLAAEPSLAGGFLWNIDGVIESGTGMAAWVGAIRNGYGAGPAAAPTAAAYEPAS
ncbi:MAG TPA: hypothetical protein VGO55_10735 [Allosphingosinicella sp.]|jgi:hypothetical protein|nr:hypothetical protein [Allosphingosinicella sp.]